MSPEKGNSTDENDAVLYWQSDLTAQPAFFHEIPKPISMISQFAPESLVDLELYQEGETWELSVAKVNTQLSSICKRLEALGVLPIDIHEDIGLGLKRTSWRFIDQLNGNLVAFHCALPKANSADNDLESIVELSVYQNGNGSDQLIDLIFNANNKAVYLYVDTPLSAFNTPTDGYTYTLDQFICYRFAPSYLSPIALLVGLLKAFLNEKDASITAFRNLLDTVYGVSDEDISFEAVAQTDEILNVSHKARSNIWPEPFN